MAAYHVLDKSVRSSIEYLEVSKPYFSPVLLDGSARSKPSSSRMALNSRTDSHGRAYKGRNLLYSFGVGCKLKYRPARSGEEMLGYQWTARATTGSP